MKQWLGIPQLKLFDKVPKKEVDYPFVNNVARQGSPKQKPEIIAYFISMHLRAA